MAVKTKRDSEEVDRLIEEVNRLTSHPDPKKRLSVNAACKKVGLQTTVYYFRKRKEEAMNKTNLTPGNTINVSSYKKPLDNRDHASLVAEARELEDRLQQLKNKIAESVMKTY